MIPKKKTFLPGDLLRSWIPPFGILFGLGAFSFSWILMIAGGIMTSPDSEIPLRFQLAWIHTLAIGFFTVTALSVLFHVMPAFTGTSWKNEKPARKMLPVLALGFIGITGFFLGGFSPLWLWGFPLAAGAILVWGILFFQSSLAGIRGRAHQRPPLAAFLLPAGFLMATAALGLAMGLRLGAPPPPSWIYSRGIPVHMTMGLLGWLTMLLWTVSSRTQGPILGTRSAHPSRIPVALGLLAVGLAVFLPGQFFFSGMLRTGGMLLIASGALVYLLESVSLLLRSSSPHPVLWAWWATGIAGLFASLATGATLFLTDSGISRNLFVYLVLAGWIQPFLLGHLHQIGVRLLATLVRGPEDETPPSRLLSSPHAWGFWALYLSAFTAGLIGIGQQNGTGLEIAGTLGILSAILLFHHLYRMIGRCRNLPATQPHPATFIRFPESSSDRTR